MRDANLDDNDEHGVRCALKFEVPLCQKHK
jgi:hypothetical protein